MQANKPGPDWGMAQWPCIKEQPRSRGGSGRHQRLGQTLTPPPGTPCSCLCSPYHCCHRHACCQAVSQGTSPGPPEPGVSQARGVSRLQAQSSTTQAWPYTEHLSTVQTLHQGGSACDKAPRLANPHPTRSHTHYGLTGMGKSILGGRRRRTLEL